MPLLSHETTIDEALADVGRRLAEVDGKLDSLEPGTDRHDALQQVKDRLTRYQIGLEWQRDEAGWGGDCELVIGPLTAGEQALLDREMPDSPGTAEYRIWQVAAATETGPYVADDVETTFTALADAHPAFVEWASAKVNDLATPDGDEGNESSMSSSESDPSGPSTNE